MSMSLLPLPYSDVIMFNPSLKPDDHMENKQNVNNFISSKVKAKLILGCSIYDHFLV